MASGEQHASSDPSLRRLTARAVRLVPAAGWTATDQVLSSLSNLVISAAVGRAGGTRLLGQFALAFTAYLLLLGFQRALVSEPLMSLRATADRAPDRAALGSAGAYAVTVAALVAAAGAVLGQPPLLVLALVLPGLLLQDQLRFQAFQRQDPRTAALLDGVWLGVVVAGLPLVVSADSVLVPLAVWGGGAALAVLVGLAVTGLRPARPATAWRWWTRDARRYGGLLALDSVVHSTAAQAIAFGLAGIVGVAELGRLRAGQLLLGVAGTALVAFNVFVLPRLTSRGARLSARQAGGLCLLATGVSLAAVGGSVVVAPFLAQVFFGAQVESELSLLLPIGATLVVASSTAGLLLHMKAMRRIGGYTVGRLTVAVAGTPMVLVAAAAGGLLAAAWTMAAVAAAAAVADVVAWRYACRAAQRATALS